MKVHWHADRRVVKRVWVAREWIVDSLEAQGVTIPRIASMDVAVDGGLVFEWLDTEDECDD